MNRDEESGRGRGYDRFDDERRMSREDERQFGRGRYGHEDRFGGQDRFEGYERGFGGDNRFSGGNERWGSRGGYDRGFEERGMSGYGGPQWGNEGYTMGRERSGGWGPGIRDLGYGQREYERGGYGSGGGYGMSDRMRGGMDRGMAEQRRMGRGPKGYQRSDERIREDVCDMLTDHDWIDASEVEIQVKGGEVTLIGTVFDRQTKRAIEDVVDRTRGVKDVHNQIRVKEEREGTTAREQQKNEKQPRA